MIIPLAFNNFLYAAVCGKTAVYGKYRSRYKSARFVVRKEKHRPDKVAYLAELFHRRGVKNFARSRGERAVRIKKQILVLLGYEKPRSDSVATDIARREMHRRPIRFL